MIEKKDHFIIAGLGLEFAVILCLGFFGGHYLDKKFDAKPLYTLACSAAAFAFGMYIVIKSALAAVNKDGNKK